MPRDLHYSQLTVLPFQKVGMVPIDLKKNGPATSDGFTNWLTLRRLNRSMDQMLWQFIFVLGSSVLSHGSSKILRLGWALQRKLKFIFPLLKLVTHRSAACCLLHYDRFEGMSRGRFLAFSQLSWLKWQRSLKHRRPLLTHWLRISAVRRAKPIVLKIKSILFYLSWIMSSGLSLKETISN